jgi:hypothetical protein
VALVDQGNLRDSGIFLTQTGDNNMADVRQIAVPGPREVLRAYATQNGTGNTASITQSGYVRGFVDDRPVRDDRHLPRSRPPPDSV